jgi:hypothetical protein
MDLSYVFHPTFLVVIQTDIGVLNYGAHLKGMILNTALIYFESLGMK